MQIPGVRGGMVMEKIDSCIPSKLWAEYANLSLTSTSICHSIVQTQIFVHSALT